ncbi:signal recognition particle-docking protein FtsY [Candidatus Pacearchaeota archaeon]|jgi:fused signal recognition particle receptor|nr:signal recognition particle-docking protein FtsY [Candidatus Pacearchaeota archaeon]
MFKFLKEKIGNWAKKISKKEEIVEKPKEKPKTKKKEPIKEIKVPMKFVPGLQKYEPDLEKLKEETPEPGTESFFKKIKSKISKVKISPREFEIYSEELKDLLLENNVAYEVTEKMIKELKEKIVGREFLKKEIESEIKDLFKEIIEEILIEPYNLSEKILEKKEKPYVILFCGINGTGKTTTIAKIADSLKKQKISSVIAAADTFRAASIEQIQEHGKKLGLKVISHEYGSDPASVGFDAIKYAKKNKINCVLIDTAGRMHTAKNLIKEIEKISRVCNPDKKIFIGESLTGNDVIEQARSFNFSIGIDGIILTKADIDEKGGTALSVGYVTKKPILYLGTGQLYEDIIPFNKRDFIRKLGL